VGGADQGVDLVADTGSAGPRGAGLWCLDKDVVSFAEHRTSCYGSHSRLRKVSIESLGWSTRTSIGRSAP
jgi:hypothetical protein